MTLDPVQVEAALQELREVAEAMPPVAAMGFRIDRSDGHTLDMHAPLAVNVNDKGTAFGGSMTSLMTFSGWALVMLQLRLAGTQADVFVADSEVRYRSPVLADLRARAWLAPEQSWDTFLATLAERGRARIQMQAQVLDAEGSAAATLSGRYVAIAKR